MHLPRLQRSVAIFSLLLAVTAASGQDTQPSAAPETRPAQEFAYVLMTTSMGDIVIELNRAKAPITGESGQWGWINGRGVARVNPLASFKSWVVIQRMRVTERTTPSRSVRNSPRIDIASSRSACAPSPVKSKKLGAV